MPGCEGWLFPSQRNSVDDLAFQYHVMLWLLVADGSLRTLCEGSSEAEREVEPVSQQPRPLLRDLSPCSVFAGCCGLCAQGLTPGTVAHRGDCGRSLWTAADQAASVPVVAGVGTRGFCWHQAGRSSCWHSSPGSSTGGPAVPSEVVGSGPAAACSAWGVQAGLLQCSAVSGVCVP